MRFVATEILGVTLIETEPARDSRGYFTRTWCRKEFAAHGLATGFSQCGTSFNARRGTLRGLHYQAIPYAEAKLVRCVRGRVFDVAVDIRPGSANFGRWVGTELSAGDGRMIYLGEGVAHGFQTLADETELHYQITSPYRPEAARGIRWDDPDIAVDWPLAQPIMSPRDCALPPLRQLAA